MLAINKVQIAMECIFRSNTVAFELSDNTSQRGILFTGCSPTVLINDLDQLG